MCASAIAATLEVKGVVSKLFHIKPKFQAWACMSVQTNLRLVTRDTFLILTLGPDQKSVMKRPYNWSPGLILGAFCTLFRAGPVGTGLGAKFGRKPAKN